MIELLLVLVVVDALNPVLAAAVIFALGTQQPYRGAFWVLLGWFVIYFVTGVGLAIGLQQIIGSMATPRPVDFVIQTPIALGLIWMAYRTARDAEVRKRGAGRVSQVTTETTHRLGALPGFLLGATINTVGLPFAIPYFAAINQILKVDLDTTGTVAVLGLYNLVYVLPFAALGLLRWICREQAAELFEQINAWMEKTSAVITPIMLFLIGAALLIDAAMYFATSSSLINVGG